MQNDHKLIVQKEVENLEKKGYLCKQEYQAKGFRLDIYATRKQEEIVIEVGYLNGALKRLQLLRRAFPNAKIVWITTIYKNWYGCNCSPGWLITPTNILKMTEDYHPARI